MEHVDERAASGVVVEAEVPLTVAARHRRLVDPVHDPVETRCRVVFGGLRRQLHIDDERLGQLRGRHVVDTHPVAVRRIQAEGPCGIRADPLGEVERRAVVADRVVGEGTRDLGDRDDLQEPCVDHREGARRPRGSDQHEPSAIRRQARGRRGAFVRPWSRGALRG